MIIVNKKGKSYDFTLVHRDTGSLTAIPKVNGEEYIMQPGDTIDMKISRTACEEPIVTIVADQAKQLFISVENSEKLEVGDYYCDITLNSGSQRDTFIKIPYSGATPVPNFHVVYGV